MARRRRRERVEPTRKEQVMTRREQEQSRRITIIVGAVLAVAALILIGGLIYGLIMVPNSTVARVEEERIATRELWNRSQFQQLQTTSQLTNLLQFQQQVDPTGEQGFFTAQIQQLQGVLANPEGLANQVMEEMIEEEVVVQAAAEYGVTVSDDEIQQELESLIAGQQGAVTAPQATATAEALAVATPTPTLTPSPTPTTTVESTATVAPVEPVPTPTVHVLTSDEFDQGYDQLISGVSENADIPQEDVAAIYRHLVTTDLLRDRLLEQLGDEMPTSGERVSARHILISVAEDAPEEEQQAALAKAISITQQLEDGADFAELAAQFSDDTSNAENGGDLGFFGRGMMVPEFEEAAFSLPVGEISDPVRTQFGYHIIRVEERDQGQPDFNAWLRERKAQLDIERLLTDARLPNLPPVDPALLGGLGAPVSQPVAVPTEEPGT